MAPNLKALRANTRTISTTNYFTTLKSTIFKISIRLYFLKKKKKNEFTEKDNSNIILIKVQTVCIS